MRAVILTMLLTAPGWATEAAGTWKMDPRRSSVSGDPSPKSITIRIESHARGEIFTMDRIEADGRATTSSTILYLDGQPREFQDLGCSGTQSSRRVDSQTVEILRKCAGGEWVRLVRRLSAQRNELVLEVMEQKAGGRVERSLLLEKQSGDGTTGKK